MNIAIKFINIESTEALTNYANDKTKEALQKFTKDKDIFVEIELSKTNNHHVQGSFFRASAEVKGLSKKYFVESTKEDLYASIDDLKDKLEEIISNAKDRRSRIAHKVAIKFKKLFKKL